MLTQERVHEVLRYEPDTGEFYWIKAVNSRSRPGKRAGCVDAEGEYRKIRLDKKEYSEHRLAWFYVHGVWPKQLIDHIDNNGLNNKLTNLREANHRQNGCNRSLGRNNTSGAKGVIRRGKRFEAQVRSHGKFVYCGMHDTLEEAKEARDEAAARLHGEFARK